MGFGDDLLPTDDDPEARATEDVLATSIPTGFFGSTYDDAIRHAGSAANRDNSTAWAAMGPRNIGGRIRAIEQDPINPATLYAGSAFGGLWKTENSGDTWQALGSFVEGAGNKITAPPIGAIGICRRDHLTVYVGTGEPVGYKFAGSGLYRSRDGGANFQRIAEVDPPGVPAPLVVHSPRFERIRVDPWQPERAWIACPTGLWRSLPGGPPHFAGRDAIDGILTTGPRGEEDISDVVIDFGDPSNAAPPPTFTVYAGVRGDGIFRAVYDTATNQYLDLADAAHPFRVASAAAGVKWKKLTHDGFPKPITDTGKLFSGYGRIKIALCEAQANVLYAIFCLDDLKASRVFVSSDHGNSWKKTAAWPGGTGEQANYDLVLEVHPDRPDIVVSGTVNLFRTLNSGQSWDAIIDWLNYDLGDRAQHADQHAAVFDRGDPRRIWIGNDGGISESRNLGRTWRKRSHGILAAQFYDLTVHPTYPFITGGGFQDNGTWVGFGGTSWHRLFGADGSAIGFQHGDVHHYIATWQGHKNSKVGAERITLLTMNEKQIAEIGDGLFDFRSLDDYQQSRLPDIPLDGDQPRRLLARRKAITDDFDSEHSGLFGGVLEGHPTKSNRWIVARKNSAYRSRPDKAIDSDDGPEFERIPLPALNHFTPAGRDDDDFPANITAIAYDPSDPDNTWWLGTQRGQIFRSDDGGARWTDPSIEDPAMRTNIISCIAVHPRQSHIVVCTIGSPFGQRVYITGDQGTNWRAVSAGLPSSPVTRVVIDPRGSDAIGAANHQILYVGTVAGVYVARNVTPDPGGPAPVWQALNDGMPLVVVRDLALVARQVVEPGGAVATRQFLRAATYGRGAYECEIDPGPTASVRLYIRSTPIDDSWRYDGGQRLPTDPRIVPATDPLAQLRPHIAYDIRIDAQPFAFFESELDGVEFDEDLRSEDLVIGERNLVHVQVHTAGSDVVNGVAVHLYFAAATPDAGGPRAPDLDGDFWPNFPAAPAAGRTWQKAAEVIVDDLGPAQPRVARFDWIPPPELGEDVALLAMCQLVGSDDLAADYNGSSLAANPTHFRVDPQAHGDGCIVIEERRVALRIVKAVPFTPDPFLRAGIDDTGAPGAVAWGGRASDIVVVDAAEADPDVTFADLADQRAGDIATGGEDNHIYVRVFNRRAVPLELATVQLFQTTVTNAAKPGGWELLGEQEVLVVPARGFKFTEAFVWNPDSLPDASATDPYQAVLLIALVGTADDPAPDPDTITDLTSFWRFFQTAGNANNAVFRGLRFAAGSL